MLYLIATPIGNLGDITFRAVETLKNCDYVLCEDSRHSQKLLNHLQISKKLISFHKFSESAKMEKVMEDLQSGKEIALISDAGTPGISDPGERLVERCHTGGIDVTSIPGPCAAIAALTVSGFATHCFQFIGFLPRKQGELKMTFIEVLSYPATTICYESPNRILKALNVLSQLCPDRQLCICRELTKRYEEICRGTASELIAHFSFSPPKGEFVLLISGNQNEGNEEWAELSPSEHVQWIQREYHISQKEAIKLAAEMRGVSKREIYQMVHSP